MTSINKIIMVLAVMLCVSTAIMWTYQHPEHQTATVTPASATMETPEPTPSATPSPTPQPTPTIPPTPKPTPTARHYTLDDVLTMANIIYHEARGIEADVELACVAWTICNRVDAGWGTFQEVMTKPNQFAYRKNADFSEQDAYDRCRNIAADVLWRWNREQNGETNVGRVLPRGYLYFTGNGTHNYFRKRFEQGHEWDYSLPDVYREVP